LPFFAEPAWFFVDIILSKSAVFERITAPPIFVIPPDNLGSLCLAELLMMVPDEFPVELLDVNKRLVDVFFKAPAVEVRPGIKDFFVTLVLD
jgi:hypothetical protein